MRQYLLTVARWLGLFPFDNSGYFRTNLAVYSFGMMLFYVVVNIWWWTVAIISINQNTLHFLRSTITTLQAMTTMLGFMSHFDVTIRKRHEFSFLIELSNQSAPRAISDICFLLFGIFTSIAAQMSRILSTGGIEMTMVVEDFCLMIPLIILLLYSSILKLLRYEFSQVKGSINVDRHEKLVFMANHINSLFGRQLLAFLVGFLTNLIVTAYGIVFTLYDLPNHPEYEGGVFTYDLLYIVFYLAELLYLCETCTSTSIEAEAFNHELFRMMRANDRLCNNKKLHLYVTMKQTVEFSACGFFKLGYPLVTSIIAAATTYLVILIQFSIKGSE